MVIDNLLWRGQKLLVREAEPGDVPRIVELHHALMRETQPGFVAGGLLTAGGPWMMERSCARHLKVYRDMGFDVWLIVTDQDEFVGNVELWYGSEPEPFGRYGHPELIELLSDIFVDEVEEWILHKAERRSLTRGYRRFWCRPEGSGGSVHLLRKRGYREVWRNAKLTMHNLDQFEPPDYRAAPLTGNYGTEASHLLALNHREAAGYRWGYIWRPVLDPEGSDFPTDISFWGSRIDLPDDKGGICLVTVGRLRDWTVAEADIWVLPELAGDVSNTRQILAIAAEQARNMKARQVIAYVPELRADDLVDKNVVRCEFGAGDPWYLRTLE